MSSINDFEIKNGVLIKYNGNKTKITVPEEVTVISSSAFSYMHKLEEIHIPDKTEYICEYAFLFCIGLKHVTGCKGLRVIEDNAFTFCASLSMISLHDKLESIGSEAFLNCKKLNGILLPSSLTYIGSKCFMNCDSLKSIKIPEKVPEIPTEAFADCFSLKSIIIPESVKSISDEAFHNCNRLSEVKITPATKKISYTAFTGCSSLSSDFILGLLDKNNEYKDGFIIRDGILIRYYGSSSEPVIPENVHTINDDAFSGTKIERIIVPETVRKMGDGVFRSCKKLKYIIFNCNSTDIPAYTCCDCSCLEGMAFSLQTKKIGYAAFAKCISLKSLRLPEGIKEIEENAFAFCGNLIYVVFSGKSIHCPDAFYECYALDAQSRLAVGLDNVHSLTNAVNNLLELEKKASSPDSD